jgi:hypothetical protein
MIRRGALGILGCMIMASVQAQTDDWMGGFAVATIGRTRLNESLLNPGNAYGIAESNRNLAGVIEGQLWQNTFRLRAEFTRENGVQSRERHSSQVLELNRVFRLSDSTTFSIGKRILSIDQSSFSQPLGFFQTQADFADLTDSLGKAEGLPMVVAGWAGGDATVAFIASNDFEHKIDGFNRGLKQTALKVTYELPDLSLTGLVRKAPGESVGAGGSYSFVPSERLNLYGSAYVARGTLRPVSPLLMAGHTGLFSRQNDGVLYPRFTIGSAFSFNTDMRIQGELIYDRRGLSGEQFDELLRRAAELSLAGPRNIASLASLGSSLTGRGARRRYLSLLATRSLDAWSLSAGTYASLEDSSAVCYASVSTSLATRMSAVMSITRMIGGSGSERQLGPVGSGSSFSLRLSY